MDIHIERFDRHRQEQRGHRVAPARQRIAIAGADGTNQRTVLHRPAIHEQIDAGRSRAVHCRQADQTAKRDLIAAGLDAGGLFGKALPHHRRQSARTPLIAGTAGWQVEKTTPVILQGKAHLRPGHRKPAHDIDAATLFGAFSLQEFQPCRHRLEQLAYRHPCAAIHRCRLCGTDIAGVDSDLPAFLRPGLARGDFQPRNSPDRWQCLTPKAKKTDVIEPSIGEL